MRVSVDKEDPGYVNFVPGTKVYLDGVERPGVFTADEDQGFLIGAPLDAQGKPALIVDKHTGKVLRTAVLGAVRVEVPTA